uniref:Uncharacterized protein n=1 Tax=Anguilla anguilla TaxID=7936 RepID=A0A0E9TBN1_ANGAN
MHDNVSCMFLIMVLYESHFCLTILQPAV